MEQFIQSAENIFAWLQPAVWVAVAAALITVGLMMAVGGEEGRTKAKKALPYVLLGCVIVLLAVSISKEAVAKVAF